MFDSKSPIVKVVGYIIIGFFGLIIIISFGMPDFLSRMGSDKTTVAVVNGEKVHIFDFLRYRDSRYRSVRDEKMNELILNNLIGEVLLLQKASELGFKTTDDRIKKTITDIPDFKDPGTGKFNYERFKRILKNNRITETEFKKLIKRQLIRENFFHLIDMGISVSSDDVKAEHFIENSKIQINYSNISTKGLKMRYRNKIIVTDDEISDEMKKNKKEIKDPKTDKARIKKKLENRKFNIVLKEEIIDKINSLAYKNGSFSDASVILNGKIGLSNIFKIGGQVKEGKKDGKPLPMISNSTIFREDCLSIGKGSTSRVIESSSMLFIFTPVLKAIKAEGPSLSEYDSTMKRFIFERRNMISRNLMTELSEKSKIIKNLKN